MLHYIYKLIIRAQLWLRPFCVHWGPSMDRPSRLTRKKFKNAKRAGERSEAALLNKASQLGFGVAKPLGETVSATTLSSTTAAAFSVSRSKLPTVFAPRPTKLAPLTPSARAAPSMVPKTLIF